jgi:hypothetical protein
MSEFFEEYTHIVADPMKTWPYFEIPGRLRVLRWSVDECYGRITPQWITEHGLTRHAVVQLALYTCQPFRDIPPVGYPRSSATDGYIIDVLDKKNGDKKLRKYLCLSVGSLVEALATALMYYESWCEYLDSWQSFQADRDRSIKFLRRFPWLRKNASRRGFTPQDPALWHNKRLPKDIQNVIHGVEAFTYDDYQHTNAPTNEPGDHRAHSNKYDLLRDMKEAFSAHMSEEWTQEATYRALATIVNQMKIVNAKGKRWTPNAIKRFLLCGPDPRLELTIKLTRRNLVPWYTRPE